jgi:hypothetical protein
MTDFGESSTGVLIDILSIWSNLSCFEQ